MVIVSLAVFGDSLGTRFLGEEARKLIDTRLAQGESVLIDFSGITSITHSFADEAFGELVSTLGLDTFRRRTHFAGANEDIKAIIRFVIAERIGHAHH
jgi:hypothetical protein